MIRARMDDTRVTHPGRNGGTLHHGNAEHYATLYAGRLSNQARRIFTRIVRDCTRSEAGQAYMQAIIRVFHGGPVGVEAVAHTMNVAVDTLIDEVEPFLLRSELIIRTPRGRDIYAACGQLAAKEEPNLVLA